MKKKQRRQHARVLLDKLAELRIEWESVSKEDALKTEKVLEYSRRERLKTLEAETSILRLMQSEERLSVQLLIGVLSFVGGSAITLFFNTVVS